MVVVVSESCPESSGAVKRLFLIQNEEHIFFVFSVLSLTFSSEMLHSVLLSKICVLFKQGPLFRCLQKIKQKRKKIESFLYFSFCIFSSVLMLSCCESMYESMDAFLLKNNIACPNEHEAWGEKGHGIHGEQES